MSLYIYGKQYLRLGITFVWVYFSKETTHIYIDTYSFKKSSNENTKMLIAITDLWVEN